MTPLVMTRRTLLTAMGVAGGLAVGFTSPASGAVGRSAAPSSRLVATWVRIGADESVTVLVGSSEMGQGVYTSLAQLVAEDLMVDWAMVRVVAAPADPAYANPVTGAQVTAGSTSVRGYYTALRTAGAAARDMLRAAAAQRFGVPLSSCVASHGIVTVTGTTSSATYGQLAVAAAALPVPTAPVLVPDGQLRFIGQPMQRVDIPAKTTGAAQYGIDVRVPGMLHAVVRHAPTVTGTLRSVGAKPAGAIAVVPLADAVVVVAATTWDAMRAAGALQVSWNAPTGGAAALTSRNITAQAATLMASGTAAVADTAGSAVTALGRAAHTVDATYDLPYLAHAAMEPLVCTASVTAHRCEVWAPTQAPGLAAAAAAAVTGLPAAAVRVHTTLLGGGLGRKFETDYVAHAVAASKAVGAPVKVTWPREEDFTHDQYRPMASIRLRAGVDAAGSPSGWWQRTVSPSILFQRGWIADGAVDGQAVEGSLALPYALPDRLVEYVRHPAGVPVGFWRSVGNSLNCFAVESALDELALAAGQDPVAFRLALMGGTPRAAAVLRAAAAASGWSTPPAAGRARGVAVTASFGSYVAQVAEVSAVAGKVKVERVWCAVDCGRVVNPDTVEAQLQGGIVHGLTATLYGRMSFDQGQAFPSNFDGYRMVRMRDMPVIDVTVLPSSAAPGGVGEPGVPAIAPAVANAWARLTGVRVRRLPMLPPGPSEPGGRSTTG